MRTLIQPWAIMPRLEESVKSSPDPKTAKEKMIQAYPNWGGVFLLDMMLPAYYKK